MRKYNALASVAAVLSLSACSDRMEANEGNFGDAIAQYLEEAGEQCLGVTSWPVDVSEMDRKLQATMPIGTAGQMAALQAAGLVKGEIVEEDVKGVISGRPTGEKRKITRYALTEAARPFRRDEEVQSVTGATRTETKLCWGRKSLDEVIKWQGPSDFGGFKMARVVYTYDIENLADWARSPQVQAAFPGIKPRIEGAGSKEEGLNLSLTSEGWEAAGSL